MTVKRVDFFGINEDSGEQEIRGSAFSDGSRSWVEPQSLQMTELLQEPVKDWSTMPPVAVWPNKEPMRWLDLLQSMYSGSYFQATTPVDDDGSTRMDYAKPRGPEVDEKLWEECQAVIPKEIPKKFPAYIGDVDGCKVYIVDGAATQLIPPEEEDGEHPPMDFIAGASDKEAPWVKRLFGDNVLLVDSRIGRYE